MGRRSARSDERAFVAEGLKVLGEALAAGADVEAVFLGAAAGAEERALADAAFDRGARVFELADGVLERVADTVTPQPVLGIVAAVDRPLEEVDRTGLLVVCADVRDPGNLGTVLRSAEAAGAAAVICCAGSVDPTNPKCVRASAGAVFHVPLVVGGDTVAVLQEVGRWGVRRLGTSPRALGELPSTGHTEADLTGAVALVLGNEAAGLPEELADPAAGLLDGTVHIPIAGRAESLNVGMAAAVLVFEAARQRARGAT